MLVLTRKRTEMIKIGDDVVITVVHTSRGSVKLGIQAPSHVRVLRAELDDVPCSRLEPVSVVVDEPMTNAPMFVADRFLDSFDMDDIAEMEGQELLCAAD